MTARLQQYLQDRYEEGRGRFMSMAGDKIKRKKNETAVSIQIDDQDDSDSLTEFCNIFCAAASSRDVRLELYGKFPVTDEMVSIAKAHGGFVDRVRGRLVINVAADSPEVIDTLAHAVKATARMGAVAGNRAWLRVSARTVSSLLRFSRVLREYNDNF